MRRGRKTAWRTKYIAWSDVLTRRIPEVDRNTTAGLDEVAVNAVVLKTTNNHRPAQWRHDGL
ncbi:MAG: hypothetical protein IPO30_20375 [Hyphomonadaceae bacterium]|nr:hypothetical protein [Hyphomonadaceae bacterium]